MKLLFAFLCCAGLCSCETMPVDDAPLDETDRRCTSELAAGASCLIDPRTYMDKPDTDLQALLSSRRFR